MQKETFFVTHDGATIAYQVVGSGRPLCFVHGFTLDRTMWQSQVEYFSQQYQVITYDLRGYGHSSAPDRAYSHSKDLQELLDYLQIKKTYLVGLSLGGEIAVEFALEYQEYIEKLILADSSLSGFKSTVNWNVHAEDGGIEAAKQRWLNHDVFKYSRTQEPSHQALSRIIANYSGWHWVNRDLRKFSTPPSINRLQEVTVPTLVILGRNDLLYFHAIAEVLVDRIEESQKVVIQEAGHMVNMDNPTAFNQELEKFLKQSIF
jgi:3-oxoadipate enol-lactonase